MGLLKGRHGRVTVLALLLAGCASRPLSPEDRMMSMRPLYAITAPTQEELNTLEQLAPPGAAGRREIHNGVAFRRVTLGGRPCLLFACGMSVVNAAMTTQVALDRFPITHVILLGAAGGVNPVREPGDVVIPGKWAYHTEAAYVNPIEGGTAWEIPPGGGTDLPNFGMIFPEIVSVVRPGSLEPQPVPLFATDAGLLAAATKVSSERSGDSLDGLWPRMVPGGVGVSGPAFVANRDYRTWLYHTWQAEVVDLESTAIAQVCWANRVPFVSVRAVAGLAGETGPARVQLTEPPVHYAARVVDAMLRELPD